MTTKFHRRMEAVFSKKNAPGLFDVIVGGDDVSEPKPSPQGLLGAVELLGIFPTQAIYVGDSIVDAKTAHRAGVPFSGVTIGTTVNGLIEAFPHIGIYQNLQELYLQGGLLMDRTVKTDG